MQDTPTTFHDSDPAGTVLLEVDWQAWIVDTLGHDPRAAARGRDVRAMARHRRWPVVCSRYLDADPADVERGDPDAAATAFVPGLGPEPGDHVLTKHGRDLFEAPATADLLADLEARHLVVTGIATDHGVALAARGAHRLGYRVTVVVDACAATSAEAHRHTLARLRDEGIATGTVDHLNQGAIR